MARKRSAAARKKAGAKKRITSRQRNARKKNMAIARQAKKRGHKGTAKIKKRQRGMGADRRKAVKTKWQRKAYKETFKKSYKRAKGTKKQRVKKAHTTALKRSTTVRQWNPYGTGGYRDTWRIPS
jgi:hypothetical protein